MLACCSLLVPFVNFPILILSYSGTPNGFAADVCSPG
nr:MAG TPA_asm: Platelet binding protein GspB adhesin, lectin, immunoglobulin fold [Bacteriophage sp.]